MCPESAPLLTVRNLTKRFGAFRALDGLTFDLRAGEILGLVGPNGSGKTTCINVISGLYPPDGGEVRLARHLVSGLPSHRLAHLGINRTFQIPKPFLSLSVRANVELALSYGRNLPAGFTAGALLGELELDRFAERPAAELNSARQKMLDLARALATGPRLLLVDELAAGLNAAELERVASRLEAIARSGVALLVVEHLLGFIDQITNRVIVMTAGKEIFEGVFGRCGQGPQCDRGLSWRRRCLRVNGALCSNYPGLRPGMAACKSCGAWISSYSSTRAWSYSGPMGPAKQRYCGR